MTLRPRFRKRGRRHGCRSGPRPVLKRSGGCSVRRRGSIVLRSGLRLSASPSGGAGTSGRSNPSIRGGPRGEVFPILSDAAALELLRFRPRSGSVERVEVRLGERPGGAGRGILAASRSSCERQIVIDELSRYVNRRIWESPPLATAIASTASAGRFRELRPAPSAHPESGTADERLVAGASVRPAPRRLSRDLQRDEMSSRNHASPRLPPSFGRGW